MSSTRRNRSLESRIAGSLSPGPLAIPLFLHTGARCPSIPNYAIGVAIRSPASLGGLFYPSLATAFLTRSRIDFAARPHWLRYSRKSSALACRTFRLSRLRGGLFHL